MTLTLHTFAPFINMREWSFFERTSVWDAFMQYFLIHNIYNLTLFYVSKHSHNPKAGSEAIQGAGLIIRGDLGFSVALREALTR